MIDQFTPAQQRALAVITVIALAFGAYFLRHYFILIVIAAIVAYLFTPIQSAADESSTQGLSATVTVLAAMATVIIPLGFVIFPCGTSDFASWCMSPSGRRTATSKPRHPGGRLREQHAGQTAFPGM